MFWLVLLLNRWKRKTISISINDFTTREKFQVERIKEWENFVKVIIHIDYMIFDKFALLSC